MKKDTLFVNLIAGPGAGKSTTAAKVFGMLKDAGINCELVREWVKDYVWEDNSCVLTDELKIFAEQNHLQHRLKGKVDVVITDAPLHMKLYYKPKYYDFTDLVISTIEQYNNLNVILRRKKKYNPAGRYQTAEQAKDIDVELQQLMDKHHQIYMLADGTTEGAQEIFNSIVITLGCKQMLERE